MQKHTGRILCKECFIKDIIDRIRNEVKRHSMFNDKHRLLLAISGGKDSFVLLDAITQFHDINRIGVVTIIEGIPGYNRREDVEWVIEKTKELGIDLILTTIKDHIGYTLEELVNITLEKGKKISPCTYCGILRRRIINKYAREHGFDRVLTAHNLDDEAQTALINVLRGDLARLAQTHPSGLTLSKLFVKKVKPLRKIYEWETATYAYIKGFKFQMTDCPYIRYLPTLRARIRKLLYDIENEKPGTMIRFMNMMDEFIKNLIPTFIGFPELPRCEKCGEATAFGRKYCKLCELLTDIGII
jgi:uncharacterized protein (TIGR00269 family)